MTADIPERSAAVHNEQVKLAATALNNIGVASIVTGAIVPLVAHMAAGPSGAAAIGYSWRFVVLWLVLGVGWHMLGRLLLKGLRT
jgi:hypothetical protein